MRERFKRWSFEMMMGNDDEQIWKKEEVKMKKTLTNNTITYNNSLTHSGSS